MVAWLKEKWKIVTGTIVGLIVALSVMLRIRGQKGVLENANRAHDAENKANDKARSDLGDGLAKIVKDKDDKIESTLSDIADEESRLADDKDEFTRDAAGSDDLAKDLADLLDVEFVDANDS